MLTSIKSKALALGAGVAALGTLAMTAITHAVDTPIDATEVSTLGGSALTTLQNAVEPVLVSAVVVIGALIGLYFVIRFIRRHVK